MTGISRHPGGRHAALRVTTMAACSSTVRVRIASGPSAGTRGSSTSSTMARTTASACTSIRQTARLLDVEVRGRSPPRRAPVADSCWPVPLQRAERVAGWAPDPSRCRGAVLGFVRHGPESTRPSVANSKAGAGRHLRTEIDGVPFGDKAVDTVTTADLERFGAARRSTYRAAEERIKDRARRLPLGTPTRGSRPCHRSCRTRRTARPVSTARLNSCGSS